MSDDESDPDWDIPSAVPPPPEKPDESLGLDIDARLADLMSGTSIFKPYEERKEEELEADETYYELVVQLALADLYQPHPSSARQQLKIYGIDIPHNIPDAENIIKELKKAAKQQNQTRFEEAEWALTEFIYDNRNNTNFVKIDQIKQNAKLNRKLPPSTEVHLKTLGISNSIHSRLNLINHGTRINLRAPKLHTPISTPKKQKKTSISEEAGRRSKYALSADEEYDPRRKSTRRRSTRGKEWSAVDVLGTNVLGKRGHAAQKELAKTQKKATVDKHLQLLTIFKSDDMPLSGKFDDIRMLMLEPYEEKGTNPYGKNKYKNPIIKQLDEINDALKSEFGIKGTPSNPNIKMCLITMKRRFMKN